MTINDWGWGGGRKNWEKKIQRSFPTKAILHEKNIKGSSPGKYLKPPLWGKSRLKIFTRGWTRKQNQALFLIQYDIKGEKMWKASLGEKS